MATSPMNKRLAPKVCCFAGGCFIYSWHVAEHLRKRKLSSRESLYVIGPKKGGGKGLKSSGFLFYLHVFF